MSEDKKSPPKKLSKADLEKEAIAAEAALEKKTKLPAAFDVKNKAGKKFHVSRDYYLKYQGELEIID